MSYNSLIDIIASNGLCNSLFYNFGFLSFAHLVMQTQFINIYHKKQQIYMYHLHSWKIKNRHPYNIITLYQSDLVLFLMYI